MGIGEIVLRALSRPPGDADYASSVQEWTLDTARVLGVDTNPQSLLITFGCPWLSPYGSHMHFFTKMPWINVFFSETTVMRVR